MDNSRQNKTDVGRSACEIAWGAEEARKMDEMVERTGHPCAGSVGGSCPVLPGAISSIAKQHADPRAVEVYIADQRARTSRAAAKLTALAVEQFDEGYTEGYEAGRAAVLAEATT